MFCHSPNTQGRCCGRTEDARRVRLGRDRCGAREAPVFKIEASDIRTGEVDRLCQDSRGFLVTAVRAAEGYAQVVPECDRKWRKACLSRCISRLLPDIVYKVSVPAPSLSYVVILTNFRYVQAAVSGYHHTVYRIRIAINLKYVYIIIFPIQR